MQQLPRTIGDLYTEWEKWKQQGAAAELVRAIGRGIFRAQKGYIMRAARDPMLPLGHRES